jgi:hypothetical protein
MRTIASARFCWTGLCCDTGPSFFSGPLHIETYDTQGFISVVSYDIRGDAEDLYLPGSSWYLHLFLSIGFDNYMLKYHYSFSEDLILTGILMILALVPVNRFWQLYAKILLLFQWGPILTGILMILALGPVNRFWQLYTKILLLFQCTIVETYWQKQVPVSHESRDEFTLQIRYINLIFYTFRSNLKTLVLV